MNAMKAPFSNLQPPPRPIVTVVHLLLLLFLISLGFSIGFLFSSTVSYSSSNLPIMSPSSPPPPPAPTLPYDLLKFDAECTRPISASEVLPTLLDRLYNGRSPYINFSAAAAATSSFLLPPTSRPRGWGSTNPVFADLISTLRPAVILELGTFLGASALHMASISSNLSLPNLILCVDDFRGWPALRTHPRLSHHLPHLHHADSLLLHQFMRNIANAGEQARVLPVPYSTASALTALCEWGVYADLVEVDAGHDFHSAWADINRAWAVLRPGGVMFGHDYHTKYDNMGVRRAVQLFARIKGVRIRGHGEHWVLDPKFESTY